MGNGHMGHRVICASSAHRMHKQCLGLQGRVTVGGRSMHTGHSSVESVKSHGCSQGGCEGIPRGVIHPVVVGVS